MNDLKPDPAPAVTARRRPSALRAVQEPAAPSQAAAPPPAAPVPPAGPAPEAAGPAPGASLASAGPGALVPSAGPGVSAPGASVRPAGPAPGPGPAPVKHGAAEAPSPQPRPLPRPHPRARPGPSVPAAPTPLPAAEMEAPVPAPRPAQLRLRHKVMILSFVALVLLPCAAALAYLYGRAADQYHSEVAFSIRSEESASAAAGLLGAITNLGTGSASDTDILFEYIRSQGIVEIVDREIDLRTIFNRAEGDPVFSLGPDAAIEDLVDHWRGMVQISFESAAGILHVEARAFTPQDAQAISRAILRHSGALVNRLSEQARSDAVRFASDELAEAEQALHAMRGQLAAFRKTNRFVDPSGDVAGQTGLLNALQTELAQALVERDMLLTYAGEGDQRVAQANRRIDAVEGRIEAERASLGAPGGASALPEVVGRYEELVVDLEFANTAYTQALANLAAARAEARRQSRYLAPHVQPTLAERALYPRRALLVGLTLLFLTLGWSMAMLVYYNVRDNR